MFVVLVNIFMDVDGTIAVRDRMLDVVVSNVLVGNERVRKVVVNEVLAVIIPS